MNALRGIPEESVLNLFGRYVCIGDGQVEQLPSILVKIIAYDNNQEYSLQRHPSNKEYVFAAVTNKYIIEYVLLQLHKFCNFPVSENFFVLSSMHVGLVH